MPILLPLNRLNLDLLDRFHNMTQRTVCLIPGGNTEKLFISRTPERPRTGIKRCPADTGSWIVVALTPSGHDDHLLFRIMEPDRGWARLSTLGYANLSLAQRFNYLRATIWDPFRLLCIFPRPLGPIVACLPLCATLGASLIPLNRWVGAVASVKQCPPCPWEKAGECNKTRADLPLEIS